MSAYDRWATQGPPEWDDELAYLEHEAREQGEADVLEEMLERGACLECYGTGYLLTGWQACGLSPIFGECPECAGTGKDVRGCDECHTEHDIQKCPEIRKELFR